MRNKRRDSSHSKKHRRDRKARNLRRGRPRPNQTPKHIRELRKILERTGQPIFGTDGG